MIDLRPTSRRQHRALAVVVAAAVLVPAAAFSAGGQAQAASLAAQRQELLDQSVVTDVSEAEQVVRVDVARDPEAADAWLEESARLLDGWTVVVAGTEPLAGPERADLDAAALAATEQPTTEQSTTEQRSAMPPSAMPPVDGGCPEIPDGPRSPDGGTTPYLGCGPGAPVEPTGGLQATAEGQAVRGQEITGASADATLAAAVDEVLAAYLPGAGLAPTTVHLDHGAATVDVDAAFAQALPEAGVYPGDVWEALLFTVHSNGAVDSVTFTLDGDCLAFAYATGGDMCAPTALPIELG